MTKTTCDISEADMNKGLIFVISGPAGSGKGTVVELLRKRRDNIGLSVSATTRMKRDYEEDGREYHFISIDEFISLMEKGEILEHTEYCGNYYGTLKSEADAIIGSGKDMILEIDVEGALQIKELMPDDTITIMLIAKDVSEQERRLRARNTETDEIIKKRILRAREEIKLAPKYDYIVVNETDKTVECVEKLNGIINSEHLRYKQMKPVTDSYFSK